MTTTEVWRDNGDGTATLMQDGEETCIRRVMPAHFEPIDGEGPDDQKLCNFINEVEMCGDDSEFVIQFNPDVPLYGQWEWRRHILVCPSHYAD